jgi:putative membrane protein
MMDWGWNGTHDMSGWMWLWMGLWSVLVIAGIVALVVLAVRALDRGRDSTPTSDALELLKRRYATGELDDEEFERRRKGLEA